MASCISIECGFSCNKTPLQINSTSDISDLSGVDIEQTSGYGNATARLVSLATGPMTVSKPNDGSSGIHIEEQIQNTFTLYGISYTLQHLRLLYGQHKLFRWTDVSGQCGDLEQDGTYTTAPFEMYCYFMNPSTRRTVCLVLPIGIMANASTNASTYFKALNQIPPPTNITLSTLFKDLHGITSTSFNAKNTILHYFGQDIRKYITSDNDGTLMQSTCDQYSLQYPIKYLLIMNDINNTKKFSTTITPDDQTALLKLLGDLDIDKYLTLNSEINGKNVGIRSSDIHKLKFYKEGVLYIGNSTSEFSKLDTNALKCYPVDPQKNIKNKELYLDETGRPTNINCPTKEFKSFVGNNKKYYCCNGTITDTNTCSNTDSSNFCGLNTDKDPLNGTTISTCDETKTQLLNIEPPSNDFVMSAAVIETILALTIGITCGVFYLYYTRNRSFSDISAAIPTANATGSAASIGISVTPVIAATLEAAKSNLPPPGWWWAVIGLFVSLILVLTAAIVIGVYTINK